MTRQTIITWIDYLFIPAGIMAGFLLKRSDLQTRSDKAAYTVFAGASAWFCPDAVSAFYPQVSANAYGLLSFVAGAYGGVIAFNFYKLVLNNAALWKYLIDKKTGGPS